MVAGDPAKADPFAIRLRMPANSTVPLHTPPAAENITVISGWILHGTSAETAAATPVATGDDVYLPPQMAHAVWTQSEAAVVQINGIGPFRIACVDPRTGPRRR